MKKKYFILLLITLIPLTDLLLVQGIPITHDGRDHVARVANFYASLSEGNLIPRWAGNLNWGYGHPVMMFLYPLSSYIASLFHFLGFNFVDSTKMVFAFSYIASGFTMFIWLKRHVNIHASMFGSILYIYSPYRFVDMYVRGAIGECVAFVFPPLIAYLLFRLRKENSIKLMIGTSLSVAGLLLSHNAISIMFLPLLGIYFLILTYMSKKRFSFIMRIGSVFMYGFLLSAFFWLPAFLEGKYTLRDIVTTAEYAHRLYPLSNFIYSPWGFGTSGGFSLQIGILQWLSILFIGIMGVRELWMNKKIGYIYLLLMLLFTCTLFIMTPGSLLVWDNVSLLQKFQFPWRFLSITMALCAIAGALLFNTYIKKNQTIVLGILYSFVFFTQVHQMNVKQYLDIPESFFTTVYNSTTDTGESSPIWSTRFMEHRFKESLERISGEGEIKQVFRNTTTHIYQINSIAPSSYVENTVYFPGWKVVIDGKMVGVNFQDQHHRGLLTFDVPSGKHEVSVLFEDTRLRKIANYITLFAMLSIGGVFYFLHRKKYI